MSNPSDLLDAADDVMHILEAHHIDAVVIGAVALAAYHYIRSTHDIDLGVNADVQTLRELTSALRAGGFSAELREPDAEDPLGGVIDIAGPFGLLQIISFAGCFPAVIEDAVQTATTSLRPGSPLRLVPLPQLIAMKLYAGGLKSKADILELLLRNPDVDLDEIRSTCKRYRVHGLDAVIEEMP